MTSLLPRAVHMSGPYEASPFTEGQVRIQKDTKVSRRPNVGCTLRLMVCGSHQGVLP